MKRLVLLVLLCLPACTGEIPEADLIGVYVAGYRGDTATLSLKADHTYTQIIRLKDGQTLESEAAWKSSNIESRQTVVEFSIYGVFPAYAAQSSLAARNMPWVIEVDRTYLGRIEICFDSDVGYCFVKQ
jgi:hypothetical protein